LTAKNTPVKSTLITRSHCAATILASVPWFPHDLGTYGIGIFTPTILAAAVGANSDHSHSVADLIASDIMAAKGGGAGHLAFDRRHHLGGSAH
jgi:hypothetical protein